MVKNLDDNLFREKIFDFKLGDDAKLLVKNNTIIEFWATWCTHCHMMIPIYEEISKLYPDIDCYRIEVERYPELAKLFEVESYPTFIFIKSYGEMEKHSGEILPDVFSDMIGRIFTK